MGPLDEGLYRHPWMQEDYHEWGTDQETHTLVVHSFYRYPENPEYGFFVKSYGPRMYDVGPVKFTGATAKRSGTCYHHSTHEAITEHIEKMYLKDQDMEKVYDLEDLAVAPF